MTVRDGIIDLRDMMMIEPGTCRRGGGAGLLPRITTP